MQWYQWPILMRYDIYRFPTRRPTRQPSPVNEAVLDDNPSPVQWENEQQKFKSMLSAQGAKLIFANIYIHIIILF